MIKIVVDGNPIRGYILKTEIPGVICSKRDVGISSTTSEYYVKLNSDTFQSFFITIWKHTGVRMFEQEFCVVHTDSHTIAAIETAEDEE